MPAAEVERLEHAQRGVLELHKQVHLPIPGNAQLRWRGQHLQLAVDARPVGLGRHTHEADH